MFLKKNEQEIKQIDVCKFFNFQMAFNKIRNFPKYVSYLFVDFVLNE